ncbi:SDR family oxidoreductase [Subtercola endophyticus]|uniref:SDR family oxidoreductase n=1 Tax=Subtercola endophyticus TaxID=2895559 RepID=UPI001E5B4A49|nr:SDR family oxidoreductase [Subtercola endophyticus]UFS60099.1 SDR family oxidoreductase [Subtercola endophyticus]
MSTQPESTQRTALVTGATGYVGGRLVPRLLDAGFAVRVLVRSPVKLADVPWADRVQIVKGDLSDRDSLEGAFDGIDVLYYLVHSMGSSGNFDGTELASAKNVASVALHSGVKRIVYLGGLHPRGVELSRHLRSRTAVGSILLQSGVPTVALQAGVVIGSGSTSFEMIRHLTEVLPYMPAPKWVRNRIQPIAIRDVLYYLVKAADIEVQLNRTFDIGGPDVLRYGQMMNGYAVEAGLNQRPIASLPVFTPWLASQWVNLVSPIPRSLAVPIIESLQFECVASEHDIRAYIPDPAGGLTGYRRSVRLALEKMRSGQVETSWQDSDVQGAPADTLPSDPDWAGHTVYTDLQVRETDARPGDVWRVIEGIGGDNGWYSFPLAWAVRGWADKVVGGVGLRRGRRNPDHLHTGDALDFWRVEQIKRGSFLRLRAEMRVPGPAWLEMGVEAREGGGSVYTQRAIFFPRGLAGRLYWYSILPFHGFIFPGMANRITQTAGIEADRKIGAATASGSTPSGAHPDTVDKAR